MHEDKQSNRYERSLTEDGRYRLLVEGIREYAIYMLDRNGKVTSWNPGAARFTGYEPGEIIGQHFSRFYVEEDRQAGAPETALAVATQEGAFEGEGWRVRKDGSRFWAHVVIDPIITNAGALVGFAKITRDLTERRQSQADIRRSEEQFRLLVQSVIDYAIYMLDPGGRITSWNQGAERLKGYSAETSSASIIPASIPKRNAPRAFPIAICRSPPRKAVSKRKDGACAKMAHASGPMS